MQEPNELSGEAPIAAGVAPWGTMFPPRNGGGVPCGREVPVPVLTDVVVAAEGVLANETAELAPSASPIEAIAVANAPESSHLLIMLLVFIPSFFLSW